MERLSCRCCPVCLAEELSNKQRQTLMHDGEINPSGVILLQSGFGIPESQKGDAGLSDNAAKCGTVLWGGFEKRTGTGEAAATGIMITGDIQARKKAENAAFALPSFFVCRECLSASIFDARPDSSAGNRRGLGMSPTSSFCGLDRRDKSAKIAFVIQMHCLPICEIL